MMCIVLLILAQYCCILIEAQDSLNAERTKDFSIECKLSGLDKIPGWSGPPSLSTISFQDSPSISPTYQSRFSIDVDNSSLKISPVNSSDAGAYRCSHISFGDYDVNLVVIEPTTAPTTSTATTTLTSTTTSAALSSASTTPTSASTSKTSVYKSTTATHTTASATAISTTSTTSSTTKAKSETITASADSSSSETVIIVTSVVGGLFVVGIVIAIILMLPSQQKRRKYASKEIHTYEENRNNWQIQGKSSSSIGLSNHDYTFYGTSSVHQFKQNPLFIGQSNRPVPYQYQTRNGNYRQNPYSLRYIYTAFTGGYQYSGRYAGKDRVNKAPNYYNSSNLRPHYHSHPSNQERFYSRMLVGETLHTDDQNYVVSDYSMYW